MEREYTEKMLHKSDDKDSKVECQPQGYLYIDFPFVLWSCPIRVVQINCVSNSITQLQSSE